MSLEPKPLRLDVLEEVHDMLERLAGLSDMRLGAFVAKVLTDYVEREAHEYILRAHEFERSVLVRKIREKSVKAN